MDESVESKIGTIVRIRVEDFVTYDKLECCPGESLNMVIGPNGSGKSTLLSAIVLGLGGKPTILGRSPNIQDYIKSGCKIAKILIELRDYPSNVKIRRTITQEGKSAYHINQSNATLKDIEALMKKFNIQLDNLCQVLPQDRVQDFAKMNKQQLLESTLKAVGKEGMSTIHDRLKDLKRSYAEMENQIKTAEEQHAHAKDKIDKMRPDVQKLEKRQALLRDVETCKAKLAVIKYHMKIESKVKVNEKKKEVAQTVLSLEKKLAPLETEIKNATNVLAAKKRESNVLLEKKRRINAKVEDKKRAFEDIKDTLFENEKTKEMKLKQRGSAEQDIKKTQQMLNTIINDIASTSQPREEVDGQIAIAERKIREISDQLKNVDSDAMRIEGKLFNDRQELRVVGERLQMMQNVRQKRLDLLQQNDKHAYEAALWVERNRDSFRGKVYLPMAVELDITHPEYTKYVEDRIGRSDTMAFICTEKDDVQTLVSTLRDKKRLKISAIHSGPDQDKDYPPPMSLAQLNQQTRNGFFGYLIDFVSGPKEILNVLCSLKAFHRVPVGKANVDPHLVPDVFNAYYLGNYRRNIQVSRYTGNRITSSATFNQRPRYYETSVDQREMEADMRRHDELNRSVASTNNELQSIRATISTMRTERDKYRTEVGTLKKNASIVQQLQFRKSQKERELQELQRKLVDPATMEQEFQKATQNVVKRMIASQKPFLQAANELIDLEVNFNSLVFLTDAVKDDIEDMKSRQKDDVEAVTEAKDELERVNSQLADISADIRHLKDSLQKKYKKTIEEIITSVQKEGKTFPRTEEDLEAFIDENLAQADLLGGPNDASLLQEYTNCCHQVERFEESIARKLENKEKLKSEMEISQKKWMEDLTLLVGQINSKFSRHFKTMKCVGEVALYTGEDGVEHDYKNYGLRIRVKFREDEELQDLDGHLQSGGERAVSTAIYMLSLQDMTPVPFRLVDEINQGMDKNNERLVYQLLLESTSRPNTPQYFLLTPKLLRNLDYSKKVNVLCIYNAIGAPNFRDWNITSFIQRRKALN